MTVETGFYDRNLNFRSVLGTIALVFCIYKYVQRTIQRRADHAFGAQHGCKPMGSKFPYKWPFALDLLKRQYDANKTQRLLAFQTPYFDRLGPNIELRLFGEVGYLTFDPENLEAILSTNFEDYELGSRSRALRSFLGEGIFTQDGPRWKHSRELLRRPFVRMQYQNLKGFGEHIDDMISSLQSSTGVVDLQPLFFRFTLATTTALIFGQPIKSFENEEQHTFTSSFDYASFISAIRIRLADFCWAYNPSKYVQACNRVKEYASGFVKQALEDNTDRKQATDSQYAFIQDLFDEYNDPVLVRDQLVNVLIAGRDTTACLLSWTFFLLVRHPPVLARLCQEISVVMGDEGELSRVHIQRLHYLKCVLNETNRLYPQLPVNVRIASKPTIIPRGGGPDGKSPVMVRRGTGIGWSTYHMHRRKEIYGEDAEAFRPERWETGELANVGWGFMPFHGGPRMCLGKDFALMEASCAIVRILQTFPNIELPPNYPTVPIGQEKQSLTIVIASADGCKVILNN